MRRLLFGVIVMASVILIRPHFISTAEAGPVYELYSLEALVQKAETIMIGQVTSVSEKMENLSLDDVTSPFLMLTVKFNNTEVLRGDQKKTAIRQYASFANTWRTGETWMVFLLKPTSLGFDPVLGGGILRISGENAEGHIVYKGITRTTLPLREIRELILAHGKK